MRVAVILVWRPKNFPQWAGRDSVSSGVPRSLAHDRLAAPYTAIHLASLFPTSWEVRIVHECVRDVDTNMDVDAVFLSTMDFCAPHASRLATMFRNRGVKVIVGGLFPTLNPDYFATVADAVVVGEAEPVMAALLSDLQRNRLLPVYRAEGWADLSELPVPRYDLVETDFTVTMAYEATRGCPFRCSFCVVSAIRAPYRRRPIQNVLRDLRAIPSHWNWIQRKYVPFWDNNLGADRQYFRELCLALTPLKRMWGTETSIDTITPESARLMGQAGCWFAYIGLESLSQASLAASNKRHNKVSEYRQRIRYLHDNGIVVMSIFLLGLDEDTLDYLKELPNLIEDIGVDIPVFSFPAPIAGTPFHRELQDAGRLVSHDLLDGMDGMHVLFRPKKLSQDELEIALFQCMRSAYSPLRIARRVIRRANSGSLTLLSLGGANISWMRHQRALARTGLARRNQRLGLVGNDPRGCVDSRDGAVETENLYGTPR
jgi:radical SAM superfamily enzyme YgiQ (UPF0313 family)